MKHLLPQLSGNWLSGLALWALFLSYAACGAWGWSQAQAGVFAGIAIALTLGCMIFAARAAENAARADSLLRKIALMALGGACLTFTGWSGHQALMISEAQRWAPYERYEAIAKANADLDAQIKALPAIPLSDEAGRPIGPVRTRELGAQRSNEIARLTGLKTPVAMVAKPTTRMSEEMGWAVVALIEALGLFGFFAIGSKPRQAAVRSAASELARKRWGLSA